MSTQDAFESEFHALAELFDQAGWLEEGTLKTVLSTGYAFHLSAKGEERLRTLYTILLGELGQGGPMTYEEYAALVWVLQQEEKKRLAKPPDGCC